MLELNKLISKWRIWINHNKTFNNEELDELEDHLLEEIDDLKNSEGLSEEEAFQKAVKVIGGREALDSEYSKVKPLLISIIHWIKTNPWKIVAYLCLLIFLIGYSLAWFPSNKEILRLNNQLGYVKQFKGSFTPFQVNNEKSFEGIDKPKIAWQKYLNKNNNPEYVVKPVITDFEGNLYYVAYCLNKPTLYSLSPDGNIRWTQENIDCENILPIKDGIITDASNEQKERKLLYYDKNGKLIKNLEGSESSIGPDRMLYTYISKEKKFFSYDSNFKIRWIFKIPDKNTKNIELKTYFYDNKAKIYILISYNDKRLILYTLSNSGDYLSEKELSIPGYEENYSNYLFMGTGKIFQDCFLVFYNYDGTADNNQMSKVIAYSFDGFEKWSFNESSEGKSESDYVLGSNSNFYLIYHKFDVEIKISSSSYIENLRNFGVSLTVLSNLKLPEYLNFKLPGKFLQSFTKDGKLLWESEIDTQTLLSRSGVYVIGSENNLADIKNLVMDTENNIYLAFGVLSGSSIYCFLQSGKNKWKIDPPNFRDKVFEFDNKVFDTRLSIGSNRSIYFVDNASNTLYCIQDKEIKK